MNVDKRTYDSELEHWQQMRLECYPSKDGKPSSALPGEDNRPKTTFSRDLIMRLIDKISQD